MKQRSSGYGRTDMLKLKDALLQIFIAKAPKGNGDISMKQLLVYFYKILSLSAHLHTYIHTYTHTSMTYLYCNEYSRYYQIDKTLNCRF
jgi:hypothetical protein